MVRGTSAATGVSLDPELREQLIDAVGAAQHHNETLAVMDGASRIWFVGPEVVDNRSVILVRVGRGAETVCQNLSTATCSREAAEKAVDYLNGALK